MWSAMFLCLRRLYLVVFPFFLQMVFSSSCTVYGIPDQVPITEEAPLRAINPYGRTKLFQEDMFRDLAASDKEWRILLLR